MSRAKLLLVQAEPWCLGQTEPCLAPVTAASSDHGFSSNSFSALNYEPERSSLTAALWVE